MNSQLATAVCILGILGLFWLDRDAQVRTSKALWLPVIWLAIAGSRMVTQWLAIIGLASPTSKTDAAARYMDGSPLDRFLLTLLFLAAVIVLVGRKRKVVALLRENGPILFFLIYCGVSALWSDYPDVAFKRWIKALADFAMVLIVLTEADRAAAIKRFLTRTGFVLVPLSILLIKYYPAGRGWSEWGESAYTGVATSKNELGGICLLFGVSSLWQLVRWFMGPRRSRVTRRLIAQGVIFIMSLGLLWSANAVTAMACFFIAGVLIFATSQHLFVRRPWLVHLLVLAFVSAAGFSLFLNVGSGIVQQMGRDPTLTGRTEIWKLVAGMNRSPLFGTGFESFWLGPRLDKIWAIYWWHPNEAHNGYIEIFLNLGAIGLVLLLVVFITSYRNVIAALRHDPASGSFRLAYFVVAIVYNFTESAIRIMHPVWILFLLAGTAVGKSRVVEKPKPKTIAQTLPLQEELSWLH
jgi:O-antigen ligase